jgi:HAD superfamily hydrolase (TIGR01456 family)
MVPDDDHKASAMLHNHDAYDPKLKFMSNGSLQSDVESAKGTIAFAFDIDGVLVKGAKPIPGAREAIKLLQDNDIPFVFLTNSGGLSEQDNIARLGLRLGLTLGGEGQIVQSHTPYRDLVPLYRDRRILVLGGVGDNVRDLAHDYGFRNVVTSSDLVKRCPAVHPFPELTKEHHDKFGQLPGKGDEDPIDDDDIAAILVWSSPRDWCLDLQVIGDLLDFAGRRQQKKQQQQQQSGCDQSDAATVLPQLPKIYFCNPDLEWATDHPRPRLAQGAFREALAGLWAYHQVRRDEQQKQGDGTKNTEPSEKNTPAASQLAHAVAAPSPAVLEYVCK